MDKIALIVLDPQNDLTDANGKLGAATGPILEKYNVISNINKLTDTYRKLGAKIIFSPIVFERGYPEVGSEPYGVMSQVIDRHAMIKGTSGAEISDLFDLKPTDVELPRSAIIAFEGTKLSEILEQNDIKKLIICGMLTDICVEGTARTAYDRGYEVITVSDATATLSLEKHEYTFKNCLPMFSKVEDTASLLSVG